MSKSDEEFSEEQEIAQQGKLSKFGPKNAQIIKKEEAIELDKKIQESNQRNHSQLGKNTQMQEEERKTINFVILLQNDIKELKKDLQESARKSISQEREYDVSSIIFQVLANFISQVNLADTKEALSLAKQFKESALREDDSMFLLELVRVEVFDRTFNPKSSLEWSRFYRFANRIETNTLACEDPLTRHHIRLSNRSIDKDTYQDKTKMKLLSISADLHKLPDVLLTVLELGLIDFKFIVDNKLMEKISDVFLTLMDEKVQECEEEYQKCLDALMEEQKGDANPQGNNQKKFQRAESNMSMMSYMSAKDSVYGSTIENKVTYFNDRKQNHLM
jgi:hypothetical protein